MRRAGLAAAVALAREQGLPADDPRVLSNRGNLLVHLAPAPVVARVATLTAWTRSDPFTWLAREVAVAGYAVQNGGPVVAPAQQAEPGPHWSRGLAVSLWTWVPPSRARPGPAEVGAALARLHLAAAGFDGELGFLSPVRAQIADGLAALERVRVLEPALLAALRDRHAEVLADTGGATGPSLVLHGDAHAGNLLHAAAGDPVPTGMRAWPPPSGRSAVPATTGQSPPRGAPSRMDVPTIRFLPARRPAHPLPSAGPAVPVTAGQRRPRPIRRNPLAACIRR